MDAGAQTQRVWREGGVALAEVPSVAAEESRGDAHRIAEGSRQRTWNAPLLTFRPAYHTRLLRNTLKACDCSQGRHQQGCRRFEGRAVRVNVTLDEICSRGRPRPRRAEQMIRSKFPGSARARLPRRRQRRTRPRRRSHCSKALCDSRPIESEPLPRQAPQPRRVVRHQGPISGPRYECPWPLIFSWIFCEVIRICQGRGLPAPFPAAGRPGRTAMGNCHRHRTGPMDRTNALPPRAAFRPSGRRGKLGGAARRAGVRPGAVGWPRGFPRSPGHRSRARDAFAKGAMGDLRSRRAKRVPPAAVRPARAPGRVFPGGAPPDRLSFAALQGQRA